VTEGKDLLVSKSASAAAKMLIYKNISNSNIIFNHPVALKTT
jgi:hypothetical protein